MEQCDWVGCCTQVRSVQSGHLFKSQRCRFTDHLHRMSTGDERFWCCGCLRCKCSMPTMCRRKISTKVRHSSCTLSCLPKRICTRIPRASFLFAVPTRRIQRRRKCYTLHIVQRRHVFHGQKQNHRVQILHGGSIRRRRQYEMPVLRRGNV